MEPARLIVGDAKSTEGKLWHVLIPRKGGGTYYHFNYGLYTYRYVPLQRVQINGLFQAVYTAVG